MIAAMWRNQIKIIAKQSATSGHQKRHEHSEISALERNSLLRRMTILLALVSPLFLAACDHKKSKPKPGQPIGPGLTNPNVPVRNVWASSIYRQNDAPCSVIYDLRRAQDMDFHVLCVAPDRKSINVESYIYQIRSVGGQTEATLVKSTCPHAEPKFSYSTNVSKPLGDYPVSLSLFSNGEYLSMELMPEDGLVDDLKTATTLHGKPVIRGCFTSPKLDQFAAQEVMP